jgi:hypothetical protein
VEQRARRHGKGLARCGVLIGCIGLVLSAAPVAHAAAKPVAAAGIGSEEARNAPWCDPKDGKLAIPYSGRPPCVRPMKQGESNGGATSRGVTRESIKVVLVVASQEQQRATWTNPLTPPPQNRATGSPAYYEDTYKDWLAVLEQSHPTWGRKIELTVFNPTGASEEAQRADALAIAALKPFAVISQAGTAGASEVFAKAIAAKKILVFTANGTNEDAALQAPYRWLGVFDNDASAVNGAEFIGKSLVGETAKWAGDPSMRTKTRVFGAIYPGQNLDFDLFLHGFAKYKGAKLAAKVQYTVPLDASQIQALNQTEAPTLVAKLKDAGVTTAILYTSSSMAAQAMKAATSLDYHPEWIFPGLGVNDLESIARSFDQAQMAHTFGIGSLPLYVADISDPQASYFSWYWGPNRGSYAASTLAFLKTFMTGVMLAGPKLTPQTFQQALFAAPPSGGAATDNVQSFMSGWGRQSGLPYDEYSTVGLDYALMWWDPNATGKSKITFADGKGRFQYLNEAKRYHAGQWPEGEPRFFDPAVSIAQFDKLPASELPNSYPCKGCPSTRA